MQQIDNRPSTFKSTSNNKIEQVSKKSQVSSHFSRVLRKRNILGSSFTSPEPRVKLYLLNTDRQSSPSIIIGVQKHPGISKHVSVYQSECVSLFFIAGQRHISFLVGRIFFPGGLQGMTIPIRSLLYTVIIVPV